MLMNASLVALCKSLKFVPASLEGLLISCRATVLEGVGLVSAAPVPRPRHSATRPRGYLEPPFHARIGPVPQYPRSSTWPLTLPVRTVLCSR